MHFRIRDMAADRCVWSIPPIDTVPVKLRCRMLAVYAFDANDMKVGEHLVEGKKLASAIEWLFADRHTSYLLVYFATDNDYAARVDRFPNPEPLLPHGPERDAIAEPTLSNETPGMRDGRPGASRSEVQAAWPALVASATSTRLPERTS